jgi:hypothetical protein
VVLVEEVERRLGWDKMEVTVGWEGRRREVDDGVLAMAEFSGIYVVPGAHDLCYRIILWLLSRMIAGC